ncbi:hypothetical protein IFT64_03765 [Oxalobacteraceae sp. CFBP 8753]|nr:hypothetical protein [Oxalobacteraceae sp. CFBP 8753]
MKIATNTPHSFNRKSGLEFVQLGDDIGQVSAIILMLEKNWGSANIDKINTLKHWVSAHAENVPCYIVGCETTIPTMDVARFHHKERDEAIRSLCDEVLRRSKSIGVRGEISYSYLINVLKYDKEQIDLIFKYGAKDNINKIRNFLQKNQVFIDIDKSLIDFQSKPFVIYEKPIYDEKNIIISKPYVTVTGQHARLNADIKIDGKTKTLWCETDIVYRQFLLSERSDAFLCALLPLAMRTKKNIICEAPVTEHFLHNISEILIPQLCAHDSRLYKTEITASSESAALVCGNTVATGMSCGVDSLYTTCLYANSKFQSMRLTHLYCGNYLYGNEGPIYERAKLVADDLQMPLICTSTNINETLNLPHLYTHFFKTLFGVLALRKLFRTYYYSTAEDFSHFDLKDNSVHDTSKFELILLFVFSCPDFQLMTGGAKSERLEKTRAISNFETAQRFLNVCLHPNELKNCGKCGKCMRTLLMLDMLNSVELFTSVFDTEEYYKNRIDSFSYLATQKNSSMLSEIYLHFLETEPELMKLAENR